MTDTKSTEYIIIGNRRIPTEIREINIFDLNYYPQNPRINYILSKLGDSLNQEIIEENLWKLDATKELYTDIEKNGGLIDEIIVMGTQVIEGNSRLCAYRHLFRQSIEEQKEKWSKIRARVILEKIGEQDLFLLLGKWHIKGKTEWDPYEKASYIHKMINENGMTLDEVADIVGMNQSSIKTQLKAYELMKDGYLPKLTALEDEKEQLKKFSIFEEYFKSSDLQKIRSQNPDILSDEKFINWVREGRVRSAAYHVKKDLPGILKSKPARKVFMESSVDDAIPAAQQKLYVDHPESADSDFKKIKEFTDFLKNIEVLKVKDKVKDNHSMIYLINCLKSEVEKFYKTLGIDDPNKGLIQRLKKNRAARE